VWNGERLYLETQFDAKPRVVEKIIHDDSPKVVELTETRDPPLSAGGLDLTTGIKTTLGK
jgi:hypothetical protein